MLQKNKFFWQNVSFFICFRSPSLAVILPLDIFPAECKWSQIAFRSFIAVPCLALRDFLKTFSATQNIFICSFVSKTETEQLSTQVSQHISTMRIKRKVIIFSTFYCDWTLYFQLVTLVACMNEQIYFKNSWHTANRNQSRVPSVGDNIF